MLRDTAPGSPAASALRSGELDLAGSSALDTRSAKGLIGVSGLKVLDTRLTGREYVYFNMLKGPTANLAVRRAIQLAFDYSGSLKEIHRRWRGHCQRHRAFDTALSA